MTQETEWVNLTRAAENYAGVDWRAFGQRDWPVRLTNRYFTGALETTITGHKPDSAYAPQEDWEPWEAGYWEITPIRSLTAWDLFSEAWEGNEGWTLWVIGPLPMKEKKEK